MAIKHAIGTPDGGSKVVSLTARKAIREKCKDCCGHQVHEVRKCTATLCPLWPFRTYDTPVDTVTVQH